MLTGLLQHADKLKYLASENLPTVLTGLAVVGTVGTAVLAGRASFKAAELIEDAQNLKLDDRTQNGMNETNMPMTKVEKVQLVWRQYLLPVASGAVTVGCIIAAHRISSKKIAALAIAGTISERALQEYKDKVVEKLGPKQDEKIRDEIAQENVTKNPPSGEVVVLGSGKVLCYDQLTGRYFQSSMEEIRRAENRINRDLVNHMYASLSMFYDEIGLPPTDYTDSVGWNAGSHMEVQVTTTLSPDNQPCLAIGFSRNPIPDYHKMYD